MTIKRALMLAAALSAMAALGVQAEERGGGGARAAGGGSFRQAASQPMRRSGGGGVVINMGRPSSGYKRNFPSRQRGQASTFKQPSWGHVTWSPGRSARASRPASAQSHSAMAPSRGAAGRGTRMASVHHHHPYTQGYVRQKLRKLGVTAEPGLITDRAELVHTDRQHSSISYPTRGPKGAALSARAIGPRGAGAAQVRTQMALVNQAGFRTNIAGYNGIENRRGHYYWHQDSGFNYCHYLDDFGYQWYGWYMGDSFFWTRDFDGRWWWYDSGDDRWCFYNDNYWWWQDPNHVGDLYCYNDGSYIPANSADDQIAVAQPDMADMRSFLSPDGARVVKLVAGGADAFLYDTANPPSFDPIYLASGVESVQFSDAGNGRPLEIVLKLDDGSFDLFDAEGRTYGPGDDDAGQDQGAAAPEQGASDGPSDTIPTAPGNP